MKKTFIAIFLIVVIFLIGLAIFRGCKKTNETSSATQSQEEQLLTRSYKITTETFVNNLKNLAGTKENESNMQMLRRFFAQNGVEMKPSESVFLNETNGMLFVKATKSHQHKVEQIVIAIRNNVPPSEIHN